MIEGMKITYIFFDQHHFRVQNSLHSSSISFPPSEHNLSLRVPTICIQMAGTEGVSNFSAKKRREEKCVNFTEYCRLVFDTFGRATCM